MKSVLVSAAKLAGQKDLMLVLVFVTILLMMILPLPTFLMDLLITLNISAGIIILLVSLHLHSPVQFSTFPSVLLVTTLFRLAISISTTRLILIEGDAGAIVETFGKVVVSGNLVVGMVIFMIITVVQFLVITKGADRVAEVGARFTLDGMPGKQMAVDADVRAGTLDQIDAQNARRDLEREVKLFGAMDGAMKFVKGDAIAGLVITMINLLGGVAIGMFQLGMDFGQALSLYALLTIGDGLVAQIPALLISVAAGTIVTRVTNPVGIDLGAEIGQQVTANRRTVMSAGFVIAVFGFIPGFPTMIFMTVGLSMAGSVWWMTRKQSEDAALAYTDWVRKHAVDSQNWREFERRSGQKPMLTIKLPGAIMDEDPHSFGLVLEQMRLGLQKNFGVQPGYWSYEINNPERDTYEIYVAGELVVSEKLDPNALFVKANATYLAPLDIPIIRHFGAHEGVLVDAKYRTQLADLNIFSVGLIQQVLAHAVNAAVYNLPSFVRFDNTAALLSSIKKSNNSLVSELRENLTMNQISTILQMLLAERVPITNLVRILEAILNNASKRDDPNSVLQQVRVELSDYLSKRYAVEGLLQALVVAPSLESVLREGTRSNGEDSFLILEPQMTKKIVNQVKEYTQQWFSRDDDPVLIAQQDIRRSMRNILHENGIKIPVLAYQEINPSTIIYPIGFVGLPQDQSSEGATGAFG